MDGERRGHEPEWGLAILRVEGGGAGARPLSERSPVAGERVRTVTRFGTHAAVIRGPHEDPEVGSTLPVSAPGLRQGASGGAVVDDQGRVVGVIRGALDDDPARVVAVPAGRVKALLERVPVQE